MEGFAPQPATKFSGSLVGSFATLPQTTDTFLREYMTASAVGNVVAALGRMEPSVRILRSMASNTQDETSTVALLAAFEAASFLSLPIGFVTERQLAALPDASSDFVLIVPNSTFVEDTTVAKLLARPKGSVVLATNTTSACLRWQPNGVPRADGRLKPFLAGLTALPIVPAPEMHAAMVEKVLPRVKQPVAWCVDPTAATRGPRFGVLCRFTTMAGGRTVGYVINMLAEPVAVGVRRRSGADARGVAVGNATDVRDGSSIVFWDALAGDLKLAPGQTLLVEL